MSWLILSLFACEAPPEFVSLSGTVYDGMEGTQPLAGAQVDILDGYFDVVGSATTGDDGAFAADARAGQPFYLHLQADGYAATGFSGSAGWGDAELEDGPIWMRTDAQFAQLEDDFAGCPGAGDGGAVIDGEVRMYINGYDRTELPRVESAWATAYDSDGNAYSACYLLDDETVTVYDPDADLTGYHGRFAIFDAPTGAVTLEVGYELIEDTPYYAAWYYIHVPENASVPMWPAYVEM